MQRLKLENDSRLETRVFCKAIFIRERFSVEKMDEKSNPLISSLGFNDGTELYLDSGDIVVFVGPNNVGKSKTLKDIHSRLIDKESDTVIIDRITVNVPAASETLEILNRVAKKTISRQRNMYTGRGFQISEPSLFGRAKDNELGQDLTGLYAVEVNNENRSSYLYSWGMSLDGTQSHPLSARTEQEQENWNILKDSFFRAFNQPIVIDQWSADQPQIRLGESPILPADEINEKNVIKWVQEFASYPFLHDQGDGMRSFAGTVACLMVKYHRICFLDEPEAFLHPPQMEIMGTCIAESLSLSQQAFVSTHSKDLIIGLVKTIPDRIKIVRITRDGNTNRFNILNNETILNIWRDPLLRHSNILEAMFYESAVVCEADADCQFYKMVQDYENEKTCSYDEALFVPCGGKGRLKKAAQALCSLGVPYVVVGDFDLLRNADILKDLLGLREMEGEDVFWRKYQSFCASIQGSYDKTIRVVASEIAEYFSGHDPDAPFSGALSKDISKLMSNRSIWDEMKDFGVSRVPSGDQTVMCNWLIDRLAKNGIYLVPVGQLEKFITEEGGHGPGWLANVIDHHSSLDDPAYDMAKEFVRSWRFN